MELFLEILNAMLVGVGAAAIFFFIFEMIVRAFVRRRRDRVIKLIDKLVGIISKFEDEHRKPTQEVEVDIDELLKAFGGLPEKKFTPGVITKDGIQCIRCNTSKSKPKKSCAQGRRNHKWVQKQNNKS